MAAPDPLIHCAGLGWKLHPGSAETLQIPLHHMRTPRYILKRSLLILELFNVGVPIVAQQLMNPTRNCEVAGSIPGLA